MDPVPLVPGVFMVPFELGQAYLWDWGDGVTLIDTSTAGNDQAIVQALRSIGRSPADLTEILLTHYHDDHRGSAAAVAALSRAQVIAHELDEPVIAGREEQPPPSLTERERPVAERVILLVPEAPPVNISRTVVDGDSIGAGGRVVHVPGHTPGSIAIHVPALGVLFTGDTIASLEGHPILGPFNIHREQAIESLRKQATLDFDVACFGHGPPLVGNAAAGIRKLAAGRY